MDINVLVVSGDGLIRDRLGRALEKAGYTVLGCPGPNVDHHCVGLSSDACALTAAADVTVLDTSTVTEVAALRAHYAFHGIPVVGAMGDQDPANVVRAVKQALRAQPDDAVPVS